MSSSDLKEQIHQLWQQANLQRRNGQWPQAVDAYSRILKMAPNFAPAYVERGLLVQEMGDPEKAMQDFEAALQIEPHYGMAYYGRGWARHARGDYAGELQDALKGLQLDPQNAGMYYRRIGSANQGLQQFQEAINAYNEALRLNSDRDEGTTFNRGRCHFEMKEYQKALVDFNRCLELDPDWAWAFAARAHVHLVLGNLKQAIADCDAAIKYQPNYIESYFTRGLAHEKKSDDKKARMDFEKVIKMTRSPQLRQMAEQHLKNLKKSWWPLI